MRLALRQREGDDVVSGGSFSAERLDVGQMAQIAARIPLGDAVRNLLGEVNPQGAVSNLETQWDGPLDAPTHCFLPYRPHTGVDGRDDVRQPIRPG